jgi:hypothetical protein
MHGTDSPSGAAGQAAAFAGTRKGDPGNGPNGMTAAFLPGIAQAERSASRTGRLYRDVTRRESASIARV